MIYTFETTRISVSHPSSGYCDFYVGGANGSNIAYDSTADGLSYRYYRVGMSIKEISNVLSQYIQRNK